MTDRSAPLPLGANRPGVLPRPEVAIGHNSNAFYLGLRRVEVWPTRQLVASVDRSIKMTRFDDTADYHGALVDRILTEEDRLRRDAPAASRCLGGQKVRGLLTWGLPELELLNARAKELFKRAVGCETAVVDACWANVYRQWDSIGAHSHRRSTASLVYCLEEGEADPGCHLSGRFSIVDPRLEICCMIEKGRMTNPFYPDLTAGSMLIFPGEVVHAVSAYSGTKPRITLSWNINPAALPGSLKDGVDQVAKIKS